MLNTVDIGRYPRGIAMTSDSSNAYVTVMGGCDIDRVDLATKAISWINGVGAAPRHVVMDPPTRTST